MFGLFKACDLGISFRKNIGYAHLDGLLIGLVDISIYWSLHVSRLVGPSMRARRVVI